MGLPERRALEQFKESNFPALKTQIQDAAGFPVDVDVEWDSLGADGYTDNFATEATVLYFTPLVNALKKVGADDMGKKALEKGLKKIVVKDSKSFIDANNYSFNDGVLTIDHRLLNTQNPEAREKVIVKKLNDSL